MPTYFAIKATARRRRRDLTLTERAKIILNAVTAGLLTAALSLVLDCFRGLAGFKRHCHPSIPTLTLKRTLQQADIYCAAYLASPAPSQQQRRRSEAGRKSLQAATPPTLLRTPRQSLLPTRSTWSNRDFWSGCGRSATRTCSSRRLE